MTVACRGCGVAGFDAATGCRACGFASTVIYPKLLSLPSPRSVPEREAQFRRIVEYAIETLDADGAVLALISGMVREGSAIALAFGIQ